MEDSYRDNVVDFSSIYVDKDFCIVDCMENDFSAAKFTHFVFKELFDIDINKNGFGKDDSTKQMTNDIGDLRIYNEHDTKKTDYLDDIKRGDLVFFHTQSLTESVPTTTNRYPGHVGIYLGNREFIHASSNVRRICIDKIEDEWFNSLVASRDVVKGILKKQF